MEEKQLKAEKNDENKTIKLSTAASFIEIVKKERSFLIIIGVAFFSAGVAYPHAQIAMWVGFVLAGYSAIANDSIQTIGTFLASNYNKKWWVLWLYIGSIFLGVVSYSFYNFSGDVSYQRLASKGFDIAPVSFSFLQIAAPIFLLILTRMRMPVSTTFLILSCFSANLAGIQSMLVKSVSGYLWSFIIAIILYIAFAKIIRKFSKSKPHFLWMPVQWITSGLLWAVWVMQDAANIAVYLPRQLNMSEFLGFSMFIFLGLGVLFYLRGDRIQEIVTEKSNIIDIRAATLVDFIYAVILYYFKGLSNIPMSTTWVFLGLLAGREIAMSITDSQGEGKPFIKSLSMMWKDASYALTGLIVSIILAIAINPNLDDELIELIKSFF
ncbi:MAG: hypothetical protein GW823_08715 [Bacteroidetes bacterium]|nr:hypothetical protein [Bacteroidota bacterium]